MSTADEHPLAPLRAHRSASCGGISVPRGWEALVLELHAELMKVDPTLVYRQVKEKFGGLRVYVGSDVPETRDLIRAAERRSERICESCGRPGVMHKSRMNWYRTLCPPCASEHEQGYTPVKEQS